MPRVACVCRYKDNGEQVVPSARQHCHRWAEVMAHAQRSVTLIDLCGHERYLKTTVFGLTGTTHPHTTTADSAAGVLHV